PLRAHLVDLLPGLVLRVLGDPRSLEGAHHLAVKLTMLAVTIERLALAHVDTDHLLLRVLDPVRAELVPELVGVVRPPARENAPARLAGRGLQDFVVAGAGAHLGPLSSDALLELLCDTGVSSRHGLDPFLLCLVP